MGWNPNLPISYINEKIRPYFLEDATYLLDQLVNNRLAVVLTPALKQQFSGHMVRSVENENPKWYKKLFRDYDNFRRDLSISSLERIKYGRDQHFKGSSYKYDSIYRELILQRLTEGYEEMGQEIPPNEEVCSYFENLLLE